MSSLIEQHPPFPSDVATADLCRISLAKLRNHDAQESRAMFEACVKEGFFLLDLQGCDEGAANLENVGPVFGLAEDLFRLAQDVKDTYSLRIGDTVFGYKRVGAGKIDAKGTLDRNEFYSICKDDMVGNIPAGRHPDCVERAREPVRAFIESSHALAELINGHLDHHLGLPIGSLAAKQRLQSTSGNLVRLIRTPPQPEGDQRTSFLPHTDIGAVTVLYNILGGLQVLPAGGNPETESDWVWVKPEPGCAIVNMGDAMVKWSNGILRSNMHRVTFPPGEQSRSTRYSVAYFARPENDTIMLPLDSALIAAAAEPGDEPEPPVTAAQWEKMKVVAVRQGVNLSRSSGGKMVKLPMVQVA